MTKFGSAPNKPKSVGPLERMDRAGVNDPTLSDEELLARDRKWRKGHPTTGVSMADLLDYAKILSKLSSSLPKKEKSKSRSKRPTLAEGD